MILIIFLCVQLSFLHVCVSDHGHQCYEGKGDEIKNPQIYLVKENNSDLASFYQNKLNEAFITLCQNYYEIHTGPLSSSNELDHIINFAVPDYWDGKPLNNFVYAGNITKNGDAICTKTSDKQRRYKDCHEFANLVSTSVLKINNGHLYDLVQAMEYKDEKYFKLTTKRSCEPLRNASDLTVVLLCLREQQLNKKEFNIKGLKLIQVQDTLCPYHSYWSDTNFVNEVSQFVPYHFGSDIPWDHIKNGYFQNNYEHKNRYLAMLTPEPNVISSESLVPTIFYETPYLYSENKTDYPNSMNLVPWRLLKYGFLKFIQTMGWRRVAIVSDDSEYSVAFEDELTALFRKEKGIVFTVIRCRDANCDMHKVAEELHSSLPRIVIANVEEKNAQVLVSTNNYNGIVWLFRDMVGKDEFKPNNKNAFSLSLRIDTKRNACDVEDNILTSLSGIAKAYENTKKDADTLDKKDFYRRFADELKRVTPRITEAEIVVQRINDLKEISRMIVNADGVLKIIKNENPFQKKLKPTDGTTNCLVTTYDYYKSCGDHVVLLLMFILMIFVLTILLITCYFDKTSPFNDIRYQHF